MNVLQEVVKEPESIALVRFQDCDPFGHLNNARYVDYFFNAREDHLSRFYDFSIFRWGQAHNESWVVTQNQIAYFRPAMVNEEVLIKTALIHYSETTLLVEGQMLDKQKKRIKALIWAEFTYVSMATGKTQPHPQELMQFFQSVHLPNSYWSQDFTQRKQQIRA